jgi:hypothetical protein
MPETGPAPYFLPALYFLNGCFEPMPITNLHILSGGQTGVDRAALDAALAAGLESGGFCPKGRLAEDGPIPNGYPLSETVESDPALRTRANIEAADATLILVMEGDRQRWGPGTQLTEYHARHLGRALHVAVLGGADDGALALLEALKQTRAWLATNGVRVLNVAGPRESLSPGVYRHAYAFLAQLFAAPG